MRRYEARLLGFCRGMLGSNEDAEDVLQEVFTSAYKAMLADDRPINTRPWLYRIARNRCLNFLRAPRPSGQDTMDVFEGASGATTAETVQNREELRFIVSDVHALPESQRTALLLREMDALSYDQIALAMDTTVPAVKSLLVRARMSLAEAGEARSLTCEEVRLELGRAAEGLARVTPPVRRHVKGCDRCGTFRRELRRTSRALAAAYPIGPLLLLKKIFLAKAGGGAVGSAAGSGGAVSTGSAVGGAGTAVGGAVSAALAPVAVKGVAGLAAAALITAGAVEVDHLRERDRGRDGQRGGAATANRAPTADQAAVAAAAAGESSSRETAKMARAGTSRGEPVNQSFSVASDPRAERTAAPEREHGAPVVLATEEPTSEEAVPGGPLDPGVTAEPDPTTPASEHGAGAPAPGNEDEATREGLAPGEAVAGGPDAAPETNPEATPAPDATVGGKTAEEADPTIVEDQDGVIPSLAHRGHKPRGGRKARAARRASGRKARRGRKSAAPASSAPAESYAAPAVDSSSPAVQAGATTPEGRQALKNLSR